MKATEQYFPVVLFIMLYKVVLTFKSVDEILKCDYSNESYWAVLSCGIYTLFDGLPDNMRGYFYELHCIFSSPAAARKNASNE